MQTGIGEIKLVIWDWFNTLSEHHLYEEIAEQNPPAYEIIQRYFYENPQRISEWAQGKLSFQKIHQHFSELTGISAEVFDDSLKMLGSTFDIDSKITPYLARFKENGVLQVIATDNFDIWDEFFMPQYSKYIELYFSGVYNSRRKRLSDLAQQEDFLKEIIESYSLKVEETLVIDDNQSYCQEFERIGGKTINHRDPTDLLQKLQQILG